MFASIFSGVGLVAQAPPPVVLVFNPKLSSWIVSHINKLSS
jgi:hypothetical protein